MVYVTIVSTSLFLHVNVATTVTYNATIATHRRSDGTEI